MQNVDMLKVVFATFLLGCFVCMSKREHFRNKEKFFI